MILPKFSRIPISGAAPYNTLIYVSGATSGAEEGSQIPMIGHLGRSFITLGTFKLIGFDPRSSPMSAPHSTTAWLSGIGPSDHCNFQFAIDSVAYAGFNPDPATIVPDGTFYFTFDIAWAASKGLPQNCLRYGPPSYDPATGQALPPQCILWEIPFAISISSYVLVYEPDPPSMPPGWGAGHTDRSGNTARIVTASNLKNQARSRNQPEKRSHSKQTSKSKTRR